MNEERPSEVLGSLPRTRPHRRSGKRAALASAATQAQSPGPAASSRDPAQSVPNAKAARPAKTRATKTAAKSAATPKSARAAKPAGAANPAGTTKPKTTAKPKTAAKPAGTAKPLGTAKRKAAPAPSLRQPPQPAGTPLAPGPRGQHPPSGRDVIGTAVQAAAEIAEIGLSAGARALRSAVSRLPRP